MRLAERRQRYAFLPQRQQHVVAVMPGTVAREQILARLAEEPLRPRADLAGTENCAGGSAGHLGMFLQIGDRFLKTGRNRRYTDPGAALAREWDLEELRQRLGIYHPERAWFLTRGADGGVWACSLTPTLPLVRDSLNAGGEAGPDRRAWELYLAAFRMTFDLARRESILLDCNPNNFGVADGRLYYVDDDLARGRGRVPFGHQALLRLREYGRGELAPRVGFLAGFAELVSRHLTDERLRAEMLEDLAAEVTWPREPELRALLRALQQRLAAPPRRA